MKQTCSLIVWDCKSISPKQQGIQPIDKYTGKKTFKINISVLDVGVYTYRSYVPYRLSVFDRNKAMNMLLEAGKL